MFQESISRLAAGLRAGEYSSKELTSEFLQRIEKYDPQPDTDEEDAAFGVGGDARPVTPVVRVHRAPAMVMTSSASCAAMSS